jgi:hypothetical protein
MFKNIVNINSQMKNNNNNNNNNMTDNKINILIFLRGVVLVSIQVVTMFQIVKYTNISILTTCMLLILFVVARTSGNRAGKLYVGNKLLKFKKNMVVASILAGLGMSESITDMIFILTKEINVNISVSIIVFFYLLVIIYPIIHILAQTTPLLKRFQKEKDKKYKKSKNYNQSIILTSKTGNICGGLSLSILLIFNLGLSWTIIINASMLMLLYFYTSFTFKNLLMSTIFILIIFLQNYFG